MIASWPLHRFPPCLIMFLSASRRILFFICYFVIFFGSGSVQKINQSLFLEFQTGLMFEGRCINFWSRKTPKSQTPPFELEQSKRFKEMRKPS